MFYSNCENTCTVTLRLTAFQRMDSLRGGFVCSWTCVLGGLHTHTVCVFILWLYSATKPLPVKVQPAATCGPCPSFHQYQNTTQRSSGVNGCAASQLDCRARHTRYNGAVTFQGLVLRSTSTRSPWEAAFIYLLRCWGIFLFFLDWASLSADCCFFSSLF